MTDPVDLITSRRIVFQGLGALGVAAALAGCGGGGDSAPVPETGTALASTSEVPVGGGLILAEEKIVLTQPTAGEFKAFTAVCTHSGNTVTDINDSVIECAFHGSHFDAGTGEVIDGPAVDALAAVAITVEGDQILSA